MIEAVNKINKVNSNKLHINGKLLIMKENKNHGYNNKYALYIPENCSKEATLIVHLLDSKSSNNYNDAYKLIYNELLNDETIYNIGAMLKQPILIPLFPNIDNEKVQSLGEINLGYDFLDERFNNVPEQLISMIRDAKVVLLNVKDIFTEYKFVIEGKGSGAKFANRFTALLPDVVKACVSDINTGLGILPTTSINDQELNYPVGIANVSYYGGDSFVNVPQIYYVSSKCDDLSEEFDQDTLDIINKNIGSNFSERYNVTRNIYYKHGINASFVDITNRENIDLIICKLIGSYINVIPVEEKSHKSNGLIFKHEQ